MKMKEFHPLVYLILLPFLIPLFSGLCPRMMALPHCIARKRSNLKSALPNARVGGKGWQVRKCQPRFRWMVTVAWLPPEACRPVTQFSTTHPPSLVPCHTNARSMQCHPFLLFAILDLSSRHSLTGVYLSVFVFPEPNCWSAEGLTRYEEGGRKRCATLASPAAVA